MLLLLNSTEALKVFPRRSNVERKKKDQASSWPHMGQYAQTHNQSPFLCCQFLLLVMLSLQFRILLLKHKCLTVALWTTVNSDLLNIKQLSEAGKTLKPPSVAKQHSNPQWEQRTWYFLCVCSWQQEGQVDYQPLLLLGRFSVWKEAFSATFESVR